METKFRQPFIFYEVAFVAYLWGMETNLDIIPQFYVCEFVAYLWGMETKILVCYAIKEHYSFVACLWGMETAPLAMEIKGQRKVCSLPMRNGNYSSGSSASTSSVLFVAYLWGMETRIHFAQPPLVQRRFVAYLWGMETRLIVLGRMSFLRVCSLPMRNGNRAARKAKGLTQEVCSLPMRNGNSATHHDSACSARFVAYLWGMETSTENAERTRIILRL